MRRAGAAETGRVDFGRRPSSAHANAIAQIDLAPFNARGLKKLHIELKFTKAEPCF